MAAWFELTRERMDIVQYLTVCRWKDTLYRVDYLGIIANKTARLIGRGSLQNNPSGIACIKFQEFIKALNGFGASTHANIIDTVITTGTIGNIGFNTAGMDAGR